jgi:hypothetical protein
VPIFFLFFLFPDTYVEVYRARPNPKLILPTKTDNNEREYSVMAPSTTVSKTPTALPQHRHSLSSTATAAQFVVRTEMSVNNNNTNNQGELETTTEQKNVNSQVVKDWQFFAKTQVVMQTLQPNFGYVTLPFRFAVSDELKIDHPLLFVFKSYKANATHSLLCKLSRLGFARSDRSTLLIAPFHWFVFLSPAQFETTLRSLITASLGADELDPKKSRKPFQFVLRHPDKKYGMSCVLPHFSFVPGFLSFSHSFFFFFACSQRMGNMAV